MIDHQLDFANAEYHRPLYCVSLVGQGVVGGQVKHEVTVSVDRCPSVKGSYMCATIPSSLAAIYL